MKKFIYIGSALLLGLLAVWQFLGNYFIDETSLKTSLDRQLPVLIGIAIVIGTIYFVLFKKLFPKGWQKQTSGGQTAIVLVFYILAFAATRQCSVSLNMLLPCRQKVFFEGIIDEKVIERTRRTRFYHFEIVSLVDDSVRNIRVPKRIFGQYLKGDTLREFMYQGPFDIKYMKK